MDISILFTALFGFICFGVGAIMLVWCGMTFVAATGMGETKIGFLTFLGTLCSIAMAWSGVTLTFGAYKALFQI